jgi:ribonuclease D
MQLSVPLEGLPEPVLITEQAGLVEVSRELLKEPILAVDTESNGLHAYREQVCLVQFSTLDTDYLIDPLALQDLSPLSPVFADPKIEKIFHAAEYDLICLSRDFGFKFANLFDTMLAARILGRTMLGLGPLLEAEFGIILDKRQQRADWGKRPLPPEQLSYARLDTHFLIPLRNSMRQQLVDRERWELAKEDFQRLTTFPGRLEAEETEEVVIPHVTGAHELTPQQYAVLIELLKYRDKIAKSQNRPLFKVFSSETLLDIARYSPGNLHELSQRVGMTPRQVDRHGRKLLQAVRQGLQADPVYQPRPVRPSDAYLNRLERLRTWRKKAAQELEVESDIILPKDLMLAIANSNPETMQDLGNVLQDAPWRFQQLGEQMLEALKNHSRSNQSK